MQEFSLRNAFAFFTVDLKSFLKLLPGFANLDQTDKFKISCQHTVHSLHLKRWYVMPCAIWYRFYNFKNMGNTCEELLLSVKLQALACNFTKSSFTRWVVFTCFKLCKWYQIVQSVTCIVIYALQINLLVSVWQKNWSQRHCAKSVQIRSFFLVLIWTLFTQWELKLRSLSILPESISKPKVFWCFQGIGQ